MYKRQTVRISAFEELFKKCFLLCEAIGGYTKDTEWLPSDVSMVVTNNNLPCGGGKQSNIGINIIFLNSESIFQKFTMCFELVFQTKYNFYFFVQVTL